MLSNTITTTKLALLAKSDDVNVRIEVAGHKNVDLYTLSMLAVDANSDVRDGTLLNGSLMQGKLDDQAVSGDAYMEIMEILDDYDAHNVLMADFLNALTV